jgi:putative Mg2+ transporter-C (MgtC) family protein
MITWHEVLLRLLIALALCSAIGAERYLAGKAAGLRTHILVGLGSAMFTIISGYAFGATAANADRIAAQVVTGIGFIGGGAILKERGSIRGLTTAAGLWAVAAIGMAAGAAMYAVAGFGTLIILLTLFGLGQAERLAPRRPRQVWSVQATLGPDASITEMEKLVTRRCRSVRVQELESSGEGRSVTFLAEIAADIDIDGVSAEMRAAGARAVTWSVLGNAEVEVAF